LRGLNCIFSENKHESLSSMPAKFHFGEMIVETVFQPSFLIKK
jgi:hypothetical protein